MVIGVRGDIQRWCLRHIIKGIPTVEKRRTMPLNQGASPYCREIL